jgi:hypothetical protein
VFAVLVISSWAFYMFYEWRTGLDLSGAFTFPLIVALEVTGIAAIYLIYRVYQAQGGTVVGLRAMLTKLYTEE